MEKPLSRRKYLISSGVIIIAVVAMVALLTEGLRLDQTKVPSALIGKPAQDFSLQWIQGEQYLSAVHADHFTLADLQDKPIVLNFWASWCHSCRAEAHDMEGIWQKYRSRGVYVVGIAIQDTVGAAQQFARLYGKNYILGLDNSGKAAIDYGVSGVPETFLIDRTHTIVYKETGPIDPAKLDAEIQKLL